MEIFSLQIRKPRKVLVLFFLPPVSQISKSYVVSLTLLLTCFMGPKELDCCCARVQGSHVWEMVIPLLFQCCILGNMT